MKDTLIRDSIKMAEQGLVKTVEGKESTNWWMWLAFTQFAAILYLLYRDRNQKSKSQRQKFREEALEETVDFDNIINSSFHSTALYDQLKMKCHPDRFVADPEKSTLAEGIFQELTRNQTNLKRLEELKQEAITQLGIKI
jgi:hypothetical protein